MYFVFKGVVFHCSVSLPEGTCSIPASKIRLMVQKSQTTTFWMVKNPINNGIIIILGGAGFLNHQQYGDFWVSIVKFLVCTWFDNHGVRNRSFSVGL